MYIFNNKTFVEIKMCFNDFKIKIIPSNINKGSYILIKITFSYDWQTLRTKRINYILHIIH